MATATITQLTVERAVMRAVEQGIFILGQGTYKATGRRFFLVQGSRGGVYVVDVYTSGLECSCPAGRHGRVCKHRAVVHEHLMQDHLAGKHFVAVRATRQQCTGEGEQKERRESSGISYGNRPISPWRSDGSR